MSDSKVSGSRQFKLGWVTCFEPLRGPCSCYWGISLYSWSEIHKGGGVSYNFGWTLSVFTSSVDITEVRARALTSEMWDWHTPHIFGTRLERAEAQCLAIKGNTEYRISEVSQPCSRRDLLEVQDSEEEQLSKGSSLVMVRKLIKWRKVMEIGFKPLATFLLR